MRRTFLVTTLVTTTILTAGLTFPASADTPAAIAGMDDDAYVTLSGQVGEIREDEFDLQHGSQSITVELDRFGWTGEETRYLVPGEHVTVHGFIDDDFFEGREIEAYNIQLNSSHVHYYTDKPTPSYPSANPIGLDDSVQANLTGTVQSINGAELMMSTPNGLMKVDTSQLGYNPFDDTGLQKIEAGDRVWVYGNLDADLYESSEIMADGLVELSKTTS